MKTVTYNFTKLIYLFVITTLCINKTSLYILYVTHRYTLQSFKKNPIKIILFKCEFLSTEIPHNWNKNCKYIMIHMLVFKPFLIHTLVIRLVNSNDKIRHEHLSEWLCLFTTARCCSQTFENIKFNVWKTKSPIQCIFNLAYNQEYTENSTNKYVCVYDCIWNSGDHSDISGVFFQFGTGGFNWEK